MATKGVKSAGTPRSTLSRPVASANPKHASDIVDRVTEASKQAHLLPTMELASSLAAAAGISRCLSEPMEKLCAAVTKRAGELSASDVANCCWALGTMNHAAPEAFAALGHRAQKLLADFTSKDLSLVAWSFAVLNVDHKLFQPSSYFWEVMSSRRADLTSDMEATLHQVLLWRKELRSEPDDLPVALRQGCAASFSRECAEQQAGRDRSSKQEAQMLLKVLTMPQAKAAGLSADEDYTIEGFSVDVLVKVQGGKPGEDQYLINFDGASHFISIVAEGLKKRNRAAEDHYRTDSGAYGRNAKDRHDGATALKYRLLRSQGHLVVPVPYKEWERRRGKETDLLSWIRKLMREERQRSQQLSDDEASTKAKTAWARALHRVRNRGATGFRNAARNAIAASNLGAHGDMPPPHLERPPLVDGRKPLRKSTFLARSMKSMKNLVPHRHRRNSKVDV